MKPTIGEDLTIDVSRLIETRLLLQANSGAGKSWALRRILEQTHGTVQHLVIDPEGEFASLREKFDYVLAARSGGDTAADPRTAKLLAERLLELGVSAILDIYELKPHERVRFVRLFIDALVDAPKALWHPVLVVIDEAHCYCPEKGEAESADAVKGLCTRGRKRGFCALLATQRLSKLHKDAAAECNNKLIGRSALDIDMKRAADELGISDRETRLKIRDLPDGTFFAFGPALCREVRTVKVGPVQTSHPKAGAHLAAVVPPPTEKVKSVLSKLADLPAEAEAREKTVDDLKRDNANLRRELTKAEKGIPVADPAVVDAAFERGRRAGMQKILSELEPESELNRLEGVADSLQRSLAQIHTRRKFLETQVESLPAKYPKQPERIYPPSPSKPTPQPRKEATVKAHTNGHQRLPIGEQKTLTALIQYPEGLRREQLTVLTGYKRSSRDAYIARLKEKGFCEGQGDKVLATDDGILALPDAEALPTGADLQDYWLGRLPLGEKAVLECLIEAYPKPVARTILDEITGYKRSSRDAYLARLSAKELVSDSGRGEVKASDDLFE